MKFWWVNQNQTYDQEVGGGYLWSPKHRSDGGYNQFYENMKAVCPGDLVFSFSKTFISDVGIVKSYCYESPKPDSFSTVGNSWSATGWRVDVDYSKVTSPMRPADNMNIFGPLLPDKYSPIQASGNGNQGVYLAELSGEFAAAIMKLVNLVELPATPPISSKSSELVAEIDDRIENEIEHSPTLEETEKLALRKSRIGQGIFRAQVFKFENGCRLSGVSDPTFLIASHIKPWRHCDNEERIDGNNGLLLTPNADKLFDRGFISFTGAGALLISNVLAYDVAIKLGIREGANVGHFSTRQKIYLDFHKSEIFLG